MRGMAGSLGQSTGVGSGLNRRANLTIDRESE